MWFSGWETWKAIGQDAVGRWRKSVDAVLGELSKEPPTISRRLPGPDPRRFLGRPPRMHNKGGCRPLERVLAAAAMAALLPASPAAAVNQTACGDRTDLVRVCGDGNQTACFANATLHILQIR
jgi:hypothetical protein